MQGRFLDFARNDDTGKALLSFFACLRCISPLVFISRVPYPPLWGTFPLRGRLWVWGSGILVSPPSPWREGSWTSPSFLWKEVPRRGGGWLPQRDEGEYTIVRPPVSSSRVQPRDLSCRLENGTYEEVRHSKSYGVRCFPLPSHLLSDRCARKISRFARNDNTGKAVLSFSTCLRHISPRGEGFGTSPSFLWKEVPRRGGGWLPQRDEMKCKTARPSFRHPERSPRSFTS